MVEVQSVWNTQAKVRPVVNGVNKST